MTTINNSSPVSSRVVQQPNASESQKFSIKTETNAPTESVSVKISDDALAKLYAEVNTNETPVEAASSGSGNASPVTASSTANTDNATTLPATPNAPVSPFNSGNDVPVKPPH